MAASTSTLSCESSELLMLHKEKFQSKLLVSKLVSYFRVSKLVSNFRVSKLHKVWIVTKNRKAVTKFF